MHARLKYRELSMSKPNKWYHHSSSNKNIITHANDLIIG